MKKTIIAAAIAAATTIGFSATAAAEGKSDLVQVHPGHWGYVQTGGNGGGVPAAHFHNDDCFPGCYPTGPGGWGKTVSDAAKGGGIPGAHG